MFILLQYIKISVLYPLLTGTNYRDMSLVETQTNHNHEEIFENIEIYKVHYKRYLNDE